MDLHKWNLLLPLLLWVHFYPCVAHSSLRAILISYLVQNIAIVKGVITVITSHDDEEEDIEAVNDDDD